MILPSYSNYSFITGGSPQLRSRDEIGYLQPIELPNSMQIGLTIPN